MRHIIALVLAVSGCSSGPLPPPVDPNVVTNPTPSPKTLVGCDYAFSAPSSLTGRDLSCVMKLRADSFGLGVGDQFGLVLEIAHAIDHIPRTATLGRDALMTYTNGVYACSHWTGETAWVPGDESWSIDVKAVCADDGTAVNALFNSLQ